MREKLVSGHGGGGLETGKPGVSLVGNGAVRAYRQFIVVPGSLSEVICSSLFGVP